MNKTILIAFTLFLAALAAGCVRRIVTIDSQPQGAEVYLDRKMIGQTPCESEFLYYGGHNLQLVKEGYANFNTTIKLQGPLYEYFPLSPIFELIIPWQITDKHNYSFKLAPGSTEKPIISPLNQPQSILPPPRLERVNEKQQ